MRANLPPDLMRELLALRDAHALAGHGERQRLLEAFAARKNVSLQKVYGWLRQHAGFKPERKKRSDSGKTILPKETLHFIAASMHESVRNTGVATKPTCVAMNIAEHNGLVVNVSSSTIGRQLRANRLDVKAQAQARNHLLQRSLHPNHVHQIDPSLCLIYYMGGKQHMMREQEFNKNKPAALDKVKLKVWRYVRYDHASSSLDVRYYEAAGENQQSLFEFLNYTWAKQEGRLSHGVPKMLLWDKGSANTSTGIKRLLDALGVHHETHATHHAWVKGGVESGNWIVERHFESRLKDEPVTSIEQLNASAAKWARDYCANAMAHIDSRVLRDNGDRYVRDDLWSLIAHTPKALIEMPAREACAYFMRGKDDTRQVRNGRISFVHPQSGRSEQYDLQEWAKEFANGETLSVSPMLMGDCVLRIELPRNGQVPLFVEVQPEREFDAFGRPMSALVMGEERRSAPHTAAQEASKQIAQTAYGADTSLDDAEAKRSKNVRPFAHFNNGKGVVAHSHLGATDLPTRLLPASTTVQTIDLDALRASKLERKLSGFELATALAEAGQAMNREVNARVAALYPDGVPESEVPALIARLQVRAGLRIVGGDV